MIYFIQGAQSAMVKIGYSSSVKQRLRTLQTASSERLVVLAIIEGTKDDERALHERFGFARAHGEWFHPHRRLIEHIDILTAGRPTSNSEYAARRVGRRRQEIQRVRINTLRKAAEDAGMSLHDFIQSKILAPMSSDA